MAQASGLIADLLGKPLIKKGTLSGNRLRNHTLTGAQINLSTLGQVPSARIADTANNLPALQWVPLTRINGWGDSYAPGDVRVPAGAVDAPTRKSSR